MNYKMLILTIALLLLKSRAIAQSIETYVGHKRIGVDLMWFKNFKNTKDEHTPFLFFSRNRANTDYKNTPTAFGSTNAISYNFKNGLGIVTVASFVNTGFIPKAGVQFVKTKVDFLFFGWLVADLRKEGNVDLFGLFRFQPKINDKWKGFGQIEFFPVYNLTSETWSFTQRLRLGIKYHAWAGGFMADFNQSGKDNFTKTNNIGVFLRYEF